MTPIGLTWTQIKAFSVSRGLPMMYFEDNNHYFILIADGTLVFEVRLRKESTRTPDQIDFEDNFKDDIDTDQIPIGTKLVGSDGKSCAKVNANQEITTVDISNNGGKDNIITVPAETTVELKVEASVKPLRKYILVQAKDKSFTWGFSNITTSFDAFKTQFLALPIGAGTSIFIRNNALIQGNIAIGEMS